MGSLQKTCKGTTLQAVPVSWQLKPHAQALKAAFNVTVFPPWPNGKTQCNLAIVAHSVLVLTGSIQWGPQRRLSRPPSPQWAVLRSKNNHPGRPSAPGHRAGSSRPSRRSGWSSWALHSPEAQRRLSIGVLRDCLLPCNSHTCLPRRQIPRVLEVRPKPLALHSQILSRKQQKLTADIYSWLNRAISAHSCCLASLTNVHPIP